MIRHNRSEVAISCPKCYNICSVTLGKQNLVCLYTTKHGARSIIHVASFHSITVKVARCSWHERLCYSEVKVCHGAESKQHVSLPHIAMWRPGAVSVHVYVCVCVYVFTMNVCFNVHMHEQSMNHISSNSPRCYAKSPVLCRG